MDGYLPERVSAWDRVYRAKLAECIERHPTQYRNKDANEVADKSLAVLNDKGVGMFDITGAGWKAAAKHFGIAATKSAWEQWFRGTLTPRPIE